jgi:glucan phosphoethanolaminetransferase (alkaline phosphatase superfamily)
MASVVIVWLPWAAVEFRQAAAMGQGFWLEALSLSATVQPLFKLTMGERSAPSIAMAAYIVAIALTAVGVYSGRKWLKTSQGVLVLALMVGAPFILALASWLWRSVYLPRAMIASVYLVSLLWAWLLCNLQKADRRVVQAILIPILGATLVAHYFSNQTTRPPWRENVAFIKTDWQPGDVMYYGSINAAIAVGYYMQGYDYALRHTLGDLNQSLTPETQAAFGFREADFDQLAGLGYKRAWLVVGINPLSNIDEVNEIHRIMAVYPNTDAQTFTKSKLGEESIYLVDLTKKGG